MTVEERTTTLYQFLIRLAGVIGKPTTRGWNLSRDTDSADDEVCSLDVSGGVWTTAAFALRILTRAEKEVKVKVLKTEKAYTPSVLPSPGGGGAGSGKMGMAARRTSSYFGQQDEGAGAGYR